MKNMSQAQEYFQAPPPGTYLSRVLGAEAGLSKTGGTTQIKLTLEVVEPEQYAGSQCFDYIGTEGSAKGSGFGKRKLREIGVPSALRALDTDEEIPDAVIANEILGLTLLVRYGNEAQMSKGATGKYDKPTTVFDPKLGKEIVINKLVVESYARHNTGQVQAPVQHQPAQPPSNYAPPAQYAQPQPPPQQYAPPQGQPQQYAPPQGYAQPAPQGPPANFGQPQWVTQGAPPQQPAQAPFQGMAPAYGPPPGAPGSVAPPTWNGGAPSQPPAPPEAEGKPKRKRAEG